MSGPPGAFLLAAILACLAASAGYGLYVHTRSNDHGFWATVAAMLGWLFLTFSGALRLLAREPLFGTFPERLLFFFWLVLTVFLFAGAALRLQAAGAFVLPFATGGQIWALLHPVRPAGAGGGQLAAAADIVADPLVLVHMALIFGGYCAFVLAGIAAGLYLLQERDLKAKRRALLRFRVPSLQQLDGVSRKFTAWGFPMLTAGILIGAGTATGIGEQGWLLDAKVIGSVIVWAFFALCLAARYTTGWQGRPVAIWTVVGVLAILFNFFGLSWLAPGFHRFG